MRSLSAAALVLALLVLPTACSTGGTASAESGADPNVITRAEIDGTQAETAYQIVQQLRPRWMVRNRGPRTISESEADFAQVVVDDMPPREFDHLREIGRDVIQEIRFLSPREATFKYGTGFNEGIVYVITRR